jgi:NADPH-dependent curcumin reductase CurA
MTQTILLKNRPKGKPKLSDFKFVKDNAELYIDEGDLLLETKYVSVDPYLR